MPVVGTAGHVDHGKTALVAALTGIDTDRLPEERARGMTTDLGFASFPDRRGSPVGVIDVPGHERYIRNMAAGAWGLDGAVLAVAADDGWMEQTERHVGTLAAFEVPVLAVAVTKADLAGAVDASRVGDDALRRVAAAGIGRLAPKAFPVDSPSGGGIASLREGILDALDRLESGRGPREDGPAYFYVDRVFPAKGLGIVLAGSLRGGGLKATDALFARPSGERLKVRGLQAYGLPAKGAPAGSRIAIAVTRPREEIRRGDCVAVESAPASACRSFYALLAAPTGRSAGAVPRFRQGAEVEWAAGTASRIASIHPCGPAGAVRLSFEGAAALFPGQRFVLIGRGSAEILAAGRVLALGGESRIDRRRVEGALGLRRRGGEGAAVGRTAVSAGATEAGRAAPGAADGAAAARANDRSAERARAALAACSAAGEPGLDLAKEGESGLKEGLSILCSRGEAVGFGVGLYMAAASYEEAKRRVLAGRQPGGLLPMSASKAATGLSRKWMIPVLNKMEDEGLVRREGDLRVVLGGRP